MANPTHKPTTYQMGMTQQWPIIIDSPAAATYKLQHGTPTPFKIVAVRAESDAGTISAQLEINSTLVTASNLSVTTTAGTKTTISAANIVTEDDDFDIVLSSPSGIGRLTYWIDYVLGDFS